MASGAGRTGRILDYGAAKSIQEGEDIKTRNEAAFESMLGVQGAFGQPGTFSFPVSGAPGQGFGGQISPLPAASSGNTGLLGGIPSDAPGAGLNLKSGSLFKEGTISDEAKFAGFAAPIKPGRFLDSEKFVQSVAQMPITQIISRQVAEAQGLVDPTSPFRQSLEQSIKSPILEAGAQALRESQRQIKNGLAKGGTARNAALAEARQMLAIEGANRVVGQQLWQANLNFESWIRDYQTSTVNVAQAFSKGLGVQEYTSAMNAASQFMVTAAIPAATNLSLKSFQLKQATMKKGVGEMILGSIGAIAGLVGMLYTGQGGGLTAASRLLFKDRSLSQGITDSAVGGPSGDTSFGTVAGGIGKAASAVKGLLGRLFGGSGPSPVPTPGNTSSVTTNMGGGLGVAQLSGGGVVGLEGPFFRG